MGSSALFSDQEIQQAGGPAPSTATASPHPDGSLFSDQEIQQASGQPSTPTPSQVAYRKTTAADPFAPAGAAERAMGQQFGDNKAQAKQALHDVGQAALMTGAGVAGASAVGAAPEVIPSFVDKAKAVYEWAKLNPVKAATIEGIAREMGIDPFQLAHKVVKYGKNLFGESGSTK